MLSFQWFQRRSEEELAEIEGQFGGNSVMVFQVFRFTYKIIIICLSSSFTFPMRTK